MTTDFPVLDSALCALLLALYLATYWLAPRVHAWNRAARWEKASWYVEPKPGSVQAWLERDRPRLHAVGAWVVSAFFLYSLRSLIVAPIYCIVMF